MVAWSGNLTSLPQGEVIFAKFIPDFTIEVLYSTVVGLAIIGGAFGGVPYWNAISRLLAPPGKEPPAPPRFTASVSKNLPHLHFSAFATDPVGPKATRP